MPRPRLCVMIYATRDEGLEATGSRPNRGRKSHVEGVVLRDERLHVTSIKAATPSESTSVATPASTLLGVPQPRVLWHTGAQIERERQGCNFLPASAPGSELRYGIANWY
jgi:hypothetical protein